MMKYSSTIEVRLISGTLTELDEIQGVLEAAPRYSMRVNGRLPNPDEAQNDFDDLPPGTARSNKYVWSVRRKDEVIGVVDAIRGYPKPSTAFLGLLLLKEREQGRGLGTILYSQVEAIFRSWEEIENVRLGVLRTNDSVIPFWRKQGFNETGEVKPWKSETLQTDVILMEKAIVRHLL